MRRVLILLSVVLLALSAAAEELRVAAAADLNFALKEIAQRYEKETGNTLKLSFGSSGNFFVQIQNGAPFDVFFSADEEYPRRLEQAGLAEPGTLYGYAIGRIVLWVPNNSKLDFSKGLEVLLDPAVKRIAIANPKHAPYGRATEAALRKEGLYDKVANRLVMGENISQTAQFVETGNAEVGIIALSLAMSPTMKNQGRFIEVNRELYPAIKQGAVVLKSSRKNQVARQFLDYMKRPESHEILRKYGFEAGTSKR